MIDVGTVLAGKYRVERLLGEGGMGVVVAAHHLHLDVPVALKILHADSIDAERIERFLREARATAQLRSENICRVMDVGQLENGLPYMVMEMLVGSDLNAIVMRGGALPVSTAVDCIMQACLGLAEAHGAGIVHRDLKPGNLFWTQRPDGSRLIKVLDFGVAKAANAGFRLTQAAIMVGSPSYMSPEQLRSSKDVDERSDIWSLGIVLYQLVTGQRPFTSESITELAEQIETHPMPPIGNLGGLEHVIARCLEKRPQDRFSHVGELAHALARFVTARGEETATAVTKARLGVVPAIAFTDRKAKRSSPTTLQHAVGAVCSHASTRGSPWRLLGAAAVFGLIVASGIVMATALRRGEEVAARSQETFEMSAMPATDSPDAGLPVVVEDEVAVTPEAVEPVTAPTTEKPKFKVSTTTTPPITPTTPTITTPKASTKTRIEEISDSRQ